METGYIALQGTGEELLQNEKKRKYGQVYQVNNSVSFSAKPNKLFSQKRRILKR